jgi:DNA replication protein DnaC
MPQKKNGATISGHNMVSEILSMLGEDENEREAALKRLREQNRPALKQAMSFLKLDMPIEQAEEHATDILTAASHLKKCQACAKNGYPDTLCYRTIVTYNKETTEFHVSYQSCEHAAANMRARRYKKDLQEKMMVSPRFRDRTFDNFMPSSKTANLLDYCKNWVASWSPDNTKGFYIFGPYGCGKTHLAVATLLAMQEVHHVSGVFMVTPDFCDQLRAEFNNGEQLQKKFNYYADAPLLVIDDLGEGRKDKFGQLAEWIQEKLYTLINHRYEHKLTTIVTSHYNPSDIGKIAGGAMASRLVEMCDFLHNTETDYRYRSLNIIE